MTPGSGSGRPGLTIKPPALTSGFRPFSVLLLASLTYILVFFTLFRTNELDSIPKADEGGSWGSSELEEAWRDLSKITAHPHPYISHANTAVHSYLLTALRDIQRIYGRDVVQISDDARPGFTRRGTWAIDRGNSPGYAVYFEGTNILVRIDPPLSHSAGQLQQKQDAVLISAHYDSVSTAPGATDAGMGVVTALQLVKYFARMRSRSRGAVDGKDKEAPMKRPVIILFNNGEEDWLLGAHSFLQHPWSNLTSTFLNLEGAGGGGRPLLFRSTSPALLNALNTDKYPHPHANVFSADAFSRGLIASGTDYSVFSGPRFLGVNASPKGGNATEPQGGMQGVDLAFYKGRNRYHTKLDAMAYTEGGKRSLWAMMESARAAADGFVFGDFVETKDKKKDEDDEREEDDSVQGAVWFDVFRKFFFLFSIDALVDFNIVFLIGGPILIIALAIFESRSSNSDADSDSDSDDEDHRRGHYGYGATHRHGNGPRPGRDERREKKPKFSTRLWIHTRFWFALLGTIGVLALLAWFFVLFNSFAVYASPYLVLLVFALTSHLTLTGLLSIPSSLPLPKTLKPKYTVPILHQKRIIFRNLYFLTWILLIVGTVWLRRGIGSGYVFSIWNFCVVAGVLLVGIETLLSGKEGKGYRRLSDASDSSDSDDEEEIRRFAGQVGGRHSGAPGRSEHAPLIVHPHPHSAGDDEEHQGKFSWLWILQFLVSVPIPLILFGDAAGLFLDASAQTLADGTPAGSLYTMIVLISLSLTLPLTPFAPALSPGRPHAKGFTLILGALTLCAGLWVLLRFPFFEGGEIKVSFRQGVKVNGLVDGSIGTVALDSADFVLPPKARVDVESTVSLTGPPLYLRKRVVPRIPSAAKAIRKAKRVGDAKVGVRCYDGSESSSNSSQGEKEGSLRKGLGSCFWATDDGIGGFHPGDIGSDDELVKAPGWGENEFIRAGISASPVSSAPNTNRTVLVKIQGRNARTCRIYIDSPHTSISSYSVSTGSNPLPIPRKGREMQWGYDIPSGGVGEVRLWAKSWGEVFNVRMEVGGRIQTQVEDGTIKGRVACDWAEYQSGMIDVGNGIGLNGPKIPAYEEVLAYLPDWVLSTKLADGLVEVWQAFEV